MKPVTIPFKKHFPLEIDGETYMQTLHHNKFFIALTIRGKSMEDRNVILLSASSIKTSLSALNDYGHHSAFIYPVSQNDLSRIKKSQFDMFICNESDYRDGKPSGHTHYYKIAPGIPDHIEAILKNNNRPERPENDAPYGYTVISDFVT